jgi:nucleoside-diphosphate-sugar epimerase
VADDHPAPRAEVAAWLAAKLGLPPPAFDPGATTGRRRPETPDRVIRNGRLKSALGWQPQYPDFRAGYASLLSL